LTGVGLLARRPRSAWLSRRLSGEHKLALQQRLRISYMPFPSFNNDEKLITLA
jgi:hypothetical protein